MPEVEELVNTFILPVVQNAREELRYLRNYKTYVEGYKKERGRLLATVNGVKLQRDEAEKSNKTRLHPIVENWLQRANKLLGQDIKPTKCFGLCTNFYSQIVRAKELESLMKELIPKLIAEVKEFPEEIARAEGVPGMEFHSQEFMSFKSRKAELEKLKKELEDGSNYMIGLHGQEGTGKSTMAIEVGRHVENSNSFDTVIFVTVSTPVDEKRIRDEIAKQLELQLEEEKLLSHAQQIWTRIGHAGKVLIILDDVWEELNLKNMGIQHGIRSEGHCSVLLTTPYENICTRMGCQNKIKLENLDEKDALNLFFSHAIEVGKDYPDELKKVAGDIVNECGRLPVMVVAVAKTLKDWPTKDWQNALITLKSVDEPSKYGIVDENVMKFFSSLKLSYTYLKCKQAQVLFLLSSIFPKAHEIPVELLSRIAIGLGLFGEVDKYYAARSQVHVQKNKLINSSLLLKAGEECVKMHDVIREVALQIGNEEIQVIMDSETKLKENMKYSSWIINGFPNCFDNSKLEVLLIWINPNEYSLKVPSTVERMKSLRVLLLHSKIEFGRTLAPSIPKSIKSLKNIRTLSLTNWELGDITVLMRNLKKLESLELTNCSITELPNKITKLDKLRFLCLIRCSLGKNSFEVIARCLQLEELYYVSNSDDVPLGAMVPPITSLPKYQTCHIDGSNNLSTFDSSQLNTSIKISFKPAKLQRIFSKEAIKSLAARAEILELEGDNEYGWNNLIPDIVSIEDGAMKDLIKLSLKHWSNKMECLVHTEDLQLICEVTIFSKLTDLQLVEADVQEICCGDYPNGFLKQLEKLELKSCKKLESTLFKGKLELGKLKSIEINGCSMTCLFHPSTAQSLRQLEKLKIVDCDNLEYIISVEESSIEEKADDEDSNPRSHDSVFSKLKLLNVKSCDQLEFILPICFCEDLPLLESVGVSHCLKLRYIFGNYLEKGGFHQMKKETALLLLKEMSIERTPLFVNIYPECYLPQKSAANTSEGSKEKDKSPSRNVSWGPWCCFMPKSKPHVFKAAQPDRTTSQEKYVGNIAHGVFTPPLYPTNLREMNIRYISNLSSLFSVSIASTMSLLEKLAVLDCSSLEHIIKDSDDDRMNSNSIFPNLRTIEIRKCDKLGYIFPASCSKKLVHLVSVRILVARQLKYVFGKSYCDHDNLPHRPNHYIAIDLPALKKLSLKQVPKMVGMCFEKYHVKALSLASIALGECPQFPINSFVDLSVKGHKGQTQLAIRKLMGMHLCDLKHLDLGFLDVETIYDVQRLQTGTHAVSSSLETLVLTSLDRLRNICPRNISVSFDKLKKLNIVGCHHLRFILHAPMSRNLPNLRQLDISDCKELERVIDEDEDDEECYFPHLCRIIVQRCERLKCLFSISTRSRLEQLSVLVISDATELVEVFGRKKQTIAQKLDAKQVFPELFMIYLQKLTKLRSICPAIDFETVVYREVEACPKISLTSTDTEFFDRYWDWLRKSEINKGKMDEDYIYEEFIKRLREVSKKPIKRHRPMDKGQQNNGSSNVKHIAEEAFIAPFAAPSQIESSQNIEASVGGYILDRHRWP